MIYVMSFNSIPFDANIHLSHRSQISDLITKEALIKVFDKYVNFTDIFTLDMASEFFEHTEINNYAIKLVDNQQPPYRPIYSLGLVELKTLKAYIKTSLANGFIGPFK